MQRSLVGCTYERVRLIWIGSIESDPVLYRATACNATHGIGVAFLSVRLSVCLSDACIVRKRSDALRIL